MTAQQRQPRVRWGQIMRQSERHGRAGSPPLEFRPWVVRIPVPRSDHHQIAQSTLSRGGRRSRRRSGRVSGPAVACKADVAGRPPAFSRSAMTLASRFVSTTRTGRLLRLPLRAIPRDAVVPVIRGPLRGARWVAGSSNHGCWLGTYELAVQRRLARAVQPGQVFYDVGANVGYYTLLGARRVGVTGRVVAFEPAAPNVAALRRHLELNYQMNVVTVVEAAAGASAGKATFATGASNSMGHLATDGDLVVEVVALDDLVEAGAIPPCDVMKVDVEGAAGDVLAGAARTIAATRPVIFLAIHGAAERAVCEAVLRRWGYEWSLLDAAGGDWVCEVGATVGPSPRQQFSRRNEASRA